jgi:hypothetical protein
VGAGQDDVEAAVFQLLQANDLADAADLEQRRLANRLVSPAFG